MRTTPPDRNDLIVELRKKGKTLQAISNMFGLTRERIRQILLEAANEEKYAAKRLKKRKYLREYQKRQRQKRVDSVPRPKPDACEVCGGKHSKICYDHDHSTGAFRGWVCDDCNLALGKVKDNPETLRKMLEYLKLSTTLT